MTRRDIWKLVKKNSHQSVWAGNLADMVAASVLAYVVSGSLLSAAYFELPYICMILMESIKQQQRRTLQESQIKNLGS